MREVIARIVDDSDFLEFKADYGPATVCGHAGDRGLHASASSPTTARSTRPAAPRPRTSSSAAASWATPIVYLQNTTGYIVGKRSRAGRHDQARLEEIQAVTNATVPQITIQCGASFGAGNYGMCGRGYRAALPLQLADARRPR